jgi:hypothetical protein
MSDSAGGWQGCSATAWTNGVELGIETFGREDAPLVLLVGGPTTLSWPDSLWSASGPL